MWSSSAALQVCSYDYERLEFILEQLDAVAGRVEVHSMTKVRSCRVCPMLAAQVMKT